MDKKSRNLYLIYLLAPGVVLMVYLLFFAVIHLPIAILMLLGIEIILNFKYPIIDFRRYFTANAIGAFVFMSIYILWHKNMPSFERHWLLNYSGILVVILVPLLGYGLRKILLDRKHMIYLAHMLMPGLIILITRIITNDSVHGAALGMSMVTIIVWQAYGSIGLTTRNFWKFYFANVIGLVLFVMVFSYEQLFIMSLPNWIEENSWLLNGLLIIPIIGLGIGWIRVNMDIKSVADAQGPSKNEQSSFDEKE